MTEEYYQFTVDELLTRQVGHFVEHKMRLINEASVNWTSYVFFLSHSNEWSNTLTSGRKSGTKIAYDTKMKLEIKHLIYS